jgi:hypothetical protein
VILAKGLEITCENGHHVATVNRNINVGDLVMPWVFDWVIPEPPVGTSYSLSRCHCGARFVGDDGQEFHTAKGWVGPWSDSK